MPRVKNKCQGLKKKYQGYNPARFLPAKIHLVNIYVSISMHLSLELHCSMLTSRAWMQAYLLTSRSIYAFISMYFHLCTYIDAYTYVTSSYTYVTSSMHLHLCTYIRVLISMHFISGYFKRPLPTCKTPSCNTHTHTHTHTHRYNRASTGQT
jgi:hypothetical protein